MLCALSRSAYAIGAVLVALMLVPEVTAAQQAGPRLDNAAPVFFPYDLASNAFPADAAQAADRKDPLVAGILSWIFPGIGSFYAGNSGHGVRHVLIEVGGFGLLIAGVAAAEDEILSTGDIQEGSEGLLIAGVAVLLVNGVWSIIAAVGDANAHNRGGGGGRGGLGFESERWVAPSGTSLEGAEPRVKVRLARLTF